MQPNTNRIFSHVISWVACLAGASCAQDSADAVDYGLVTGAQVVAGSGAVSGSDAAAERGSSNINDDKQQGCDSKKGNCPKPTKDIKVTLRFNAKVGEKNFACGHEYQMGTKRTKMTPSDLRLNFQDVALIRDDKTEVPLKLDVNKWQGPNIALLDFEDATGSCQGSGTPATNKVITGTIPDGKYVGIAFTNGVPEALDHGDPLKAPEPLKSSNMLWSWLVGYRFTQIEFVQVVPQGQDFATAWLHVGSTGCSGDPQAGSVTCAKPNRNRIVLKKFDFQKDTVTVDPGAIWANEAITQDVGCHSVGDACASLFPRIGLDYNTGKVTSNQAVYRIEN